MSKLVWITPDAEKVMAYCARVSNPGNQEAMEDGRLGAAGLLSYCARKRHWSVFEMATACVEIDTTRAISAQIIRHRSFSFQEFSQRYAEVAPDIPVPEMRQKAQGGNRQGSGAVIEDAYTSGLVDAALTIAKDSYTHLIGEGVAPETARMVLPMCAPTRLYMSGTIRSWIHYLDLRGKEDVQKEHREIAFSIRAILAGELPLLAEVFKWHTGGK